MKASPMTVKTTVVSHIGCVRKNNEDNFYLNGDYMLASEVDAGAQVELVSDDHQQLYAICDGMGGLNGGERASLIAIEAMSELNKRQEKGKIAEAIRHYADKASQLVYEDAQHSGSKKQGSTMCMLMIHDNIGYVANVGDSRVYIVRMGELVQVSYDHTDVYRLMMQGRLTREQARTHPKGNVISHYIGQPKANRGADFAYYRSLLLCNGDRFMLCSDGLSDLLTHEQIQHVLTTTRSSAEAVEKLISMALEMGGKDNVTCMVGDIVGQSLPAQTKDTLAALTTQLEKTEEMTS